MSHNSNLGPDIKGAEYSCEPRMKYPDDETDEDEMILLIVTLWKKNFNILLFLVKNGIRQ